MKQFLILHFELYYSLTKTVPYNTNCYLKYVQNY